MFNSEEVCVYILETCLSSRYQICNHPSLLSDCGRSFRVHGKFDQDTACGLIKILCVFILGKNHTENNFKSKINIVCVQVRSIIVTHKVQHSQPVQFSAFLCVQTLSINDETGVNL